MGWDVFCWDCWVNSGCNIMLWRCKAEVVACTEVFLDKREFTGPVYEQIEESVAFVLRNRTLANVLGQMGLVESWGTGIKRIRKAAEEYSLPVPEFQAFDNMFRVSLFRALSPASIQQNDGTPSEKHRKNIGKTLEKHRRNSREASEISRKNPMNKENLNNTQQKILDLLSETTRLSVSKIAEHIGISRRNVESSIKKLEDQGVLVRHGSPKNGYWEII